MANRLRLCKDTLCKEQAMARTVNITVSKSTLDWSDFEVVGEDDIADGDAEAGADISMTWSSSGSDLTVEISVQHTAKVESDTAQTATLLRHEQGHLDLGILVARRIKRDIVAGTSLGSARTTHMPRLTAANVRYDTNTNHGQTTANQSRWNTALDAALAAASPPASVNGSAL
jgi:hypothetical protein